MSEAEDPRIGMVMDGRYTIDRKIADGGMATVYLATDSRLERKVAVKIMHSQLAQGPRRDQFVQRFHREARSAAAVVNQHIVQVYDTGQFQGLDYLVMEYVHGINLRRAIIDNGTFSVRDTLRIIGETLDGLAAAHRAGLVHRDVKPENILINDRGGVEITDFGLAKAVSEATLASTGLLLGTAAYLAPEMIENNTASPQGDLYSVGIMAWEMLSGNVPFLSDNPVTMVFKHVHDDVPSLVSLGKGVPEPVSRFVGHLTARPMDARPADAGAALQELNALVRTLSPDQLAFRVAPPQGTGTPAAPPKPVVGTKPLQDDPTMAFDGGDDPLAPPVPPQGHGPAKPAADGKNGKGNSGEGNKGNKGSHPWRKAIVIAVIVALVAAGCGIGGWWWYFQGPSSYWTVPQAEDVQCAEGQPCSAVGAEWSKYEQLLKVSGIPYETSEDYSDTIAEGHVMAIDPDVNAHVSKRAGGTVHVTISKGIRQATVPANLLDCSATPDPVQALKNAGFTNLPSSDSIAKEYSAQVPQGCAISVSPEPGATTNHDATITMTVSQGPQPVQMPDVVGKSKDDAVAALVQLQLNVKYTIEHSDSVESGHVVSADHDAGSQLHWGDTVNLVVSDGPEMGSIPSGLVGKSESTVTKQLESLGFKVKTERVLGGVFGTVRDIMNGDTSVSGGAQVRLRDKNGNPTTLTIKVV